jgi:tetrahydrodipicolinate N-succinyltransferase
MRDIATSRRISSVRSTAHVADLEPRGRREDAAAGRRSATLPRGATILIVAALVAFGAAHVIGGTMIHSRSNAAAAGQHMLAAD